MIKRMIKSLVIAIVLSICSNSFAAVSSVERAGGSEAFPVGSVFIAVVSTDPTTLLGYGTWSAIGAGRVLVGLDSGDTDFDTVEETGGNKTNTPSAHSGTAVGTSGPGSSHSHSHSHGSGSLTSPTTGAEAAHTHTYTDVVAHTHSVPVNSGFTGGSSGYAQDTSVNGSLTSGSTGSASGTTAAGSSHTHAGGAVTGTTAIDATTESVHTHAAGTVTQPTAHSALSVVQPYFVVYMWKRTA